MAAQVNDGFKKTVEERIKDFKAELNEVRREHELWEQSLAGKYKDDIYTQYLRGKMLEKNGLDRLIDDFENPGGHFTKRYRILEGRGTKLTTDLDSIDVSGRDSLRQKRKEAYKGIYDLIAKLVKKAHSNGLVCPECEVQN